METSTVARRYYELLDRGDYPALADLLDAEFIHNRPDRQITGREAFLEFMRSERPKQDTTHAIDHVFDSDDKVAVEGRLLTTDGDCWFRFVDVHQVTDATIQHIRTYTA